MIRYIFKLLFIVTVHTVAQISNVRQTIENNRIVITYDLLGSDGDCYNIDITSTNEDAEIITPHAVVGDINRVLPGKDRSIWWETQIEGLNQRGWKISLAIKNGFSIKWIFVQGGPTGDFYISATEVTFEQYDWFCDATGYKKPIAKFGRGKETVINVNVVDAVAFCNWLSKETGKTVRLPEEKEWEYAAKGGNKSRSYKYSGSNTVDEVAWYSRNSGKRTHEVATKEPNELGIYDMSGNVWEWCGTFGALRGGSWGYDNDSCSLSPIHPFNPDHYDNYGFRVLQK